MHCSSICFWCFAVIFLHVLVESWIRADACSYARSFQPVRSESLRLRGGARIGHSKRPPAPTPTKVDEAADSRSRRKAKQTDHRPRVTRRTRRAQALLSPSSAFFPYCVFLIFFLQDHSEESDSYGSAYDPEDSRDDTIEQDGEWKGSEDTRYQYVTA